MAGFVNEKDRRIIPRWRSFNRTLQLGELSPSEICRSDPRIPHNFLVAKINDWDKFRTVAHAADLVGSAALVFKNPPYDPRIDNAAKFLISQDVGVSEWSKKIAKRILGISEQVNFSHDSQEEYKQILYNKIRYLKQLLNVNPNNVIAWVEISRCYACLGQNDQAAHSMDIAIKIEKDNRFVVRSASRLWVHLDEIDKAHHTILRSERTIHDPWLLAAEIAIGSFDGQSPKLVRHARKMLYRDAMYDKHVSELASALATLEYVDGSTNKAKELFRRSLIDPTENSVAQACWASGSRLRLDDIPQNIKSQQDMFVTQNVLDSKDTFEAKFIFYYQNAQWNDAIDTFHGWKMDQSFSSKPYILGSFVSAVAMEDYISGEKFSSQGLISNPDDFTLLNNSAFCLINIGNLDKAKKRISKIETLGLVSDDKRYEVVLGATKGLFDFRSGDVKSGRILYKKACSKAKDMNDEHLFARAMAFYAIEELAQTHPDYDVINESLECKNDTNNPMLEVLHKRIIDKRNM